MSISNLTGNYSLSVDATLYGALHKKDQEKVVREAVNSGSKAPAVEQLPRGRDDIDRLKNALLLRGMEMRYVVNQATGDAQIIISESGTGREVLKIPSDSAVVGSLLQAVDVRR